MRRMNSESHKSGYKEEASPKNEENFYPWDN
jgi:hypothetical protein